MNELIIIREQEILGHDFRVFGDAETPLFLASDVAEWIEHSNVSEMLNMVDDNERTKITPKQSLGVLRKNVEYNFLTEDGLYEVLFQSRKPIAKEFKKQVKHILKEIRTKGGYISDKYRFWSNELLKSKRHNHADVRQLAILDGIGLPDLPPANQNEYEKALQKQRVADFEKIYDLVMKQIIEDIEASTPKLPWDASDECGLLKHIMGESDFGQLFGVPQLMKTSE